MTTRVGKHAIIIGGSLAGLLTARALSRHFEQVTILERDRVEDRPDARKGQPQARHLHGLLAKGLDTLNDLFPGLTEELVAHGALTLDMGENMRWHAFGGYRIQYPSGLTGALMSRPLLEWVIRRRVINIENVELKDNTGVADLIYDRTGGRVVGVCIQRRRSIRDHVPGAGSDSRTTLYGDLVVDASGRGSRSERWLDELGYALPERQEVRVGIGYATRLYHRRPGDLSDASLLMISPAPPRCKRTGLLFPIEGDRWIVTLGGWAGDHPPGDEEGFNEFANSLAVPDLAQILGRLEPVSEIRVHRYPSSLRRHYEKLDRFPQGFLVIGDAICSFNPVYGQGMTSAILQSVALDQILGEPGGRSDLARHFFSKASRIVDIPWQLAVGEDFRFPETEGPKPFGVDFINRYVEMVHRATHVDEVVYGAFLQVMNLNQPPTSLFHPRILGRVLGSRLGRKQAGSGNATLASATRTH